MNPIPRLYAIADAQYGDPVRIAAALFAGGAELVQVRNKEAGARELLNQVEQIIGMCPPGGVVIVNDRVDVARLSGAGGVHLGQDDLPVTMAREILGPDVMIGISTHTLAQVHQTADLPVDYIAIGPIFQTLSRKDPSPVVGLDVLKAITRATSKPIVAIGGITLENCQKVFASGIQSVAVIRDLLNTPDITARVRAWIRCCQSWAS